MRRHIVAGLCSTALIASGLAAHAQTRPPNLVPPGWSTQQVEGRNDVIRYVSPDGAAVLTLHDLPRQGLSLREELADASGQSGEITYRRVADSWFVISGYRGERIFYTRVELACGGRRWHMAELTYPKEQKRKLDAAVTHASRTLRNYRSVCPNGA
jgi:hypothetical protein